jgi:nucleoside 2-deoxyribosyltransferase
MRIYLAGYINGNLIKQCAEWRIKIREHYARKGWDIVWLDPLNGKEFAEITEDGLKSNVPAEAIFDRDLMSVKEADLLIVNMNTFGATRPPLGTICELAWAGYLNKPIIFISKDVNYIEHPFVKRMVSWIVPDIDTLLKEKIINYFYKGINTAVYDYWVKHYRPKEYARERI